MLQFARTAEAIGGARSTLQKSTILAGYLRSLEGESLRRAAIYLSGQPYGRAERKVLNLGWTALARVVERLSGREPARLSEAYLRHSDLGDWAGEALEAATRPQPTSLPDVAEGVEAIRTARGAAAKQDALQTLLLRLQPLEAKYLIKVLSGDLRIGLREGLVEAALAEAFAVPLAAVKRLHLLTGDIGETALRCRAGELGESAIQLFRPIRFMLASPVETVEEAIARVAEPPAWTEEKYDGVRCQLHVEGARVELFSRDLKETTAAFPEVAEAAPSIGHSLLLDGEILAHSGDQVLPFFELQRRLGRKLVSGELRAQVPVVLVAFDLLALDGETLLDHPLRERRARLESLHLKPPFLLARVERAATAAELDRLFAETRARGNEGLMVKDPGGAYTPGRRGLSWLKLKRPLATLDVVVTAVEWGHGKRRGVLSDYTFAVLDEQSGKLVNVGKAYSGLTDAEIAELTEHFLATTTADHGRQRTVVPDTVLEVAFDSIQRSNRHRAGFALRFPRIVRVRTDKPVAEIDTRRRVEELFERYYGKGVPLSEVAEVVGP